MGGTSGTSSKRKSSSSLKKKRSHNLSKVRKRKISRSKSRKNKSKKLRRRDDSISYSDSDHDSRSSATILSSSSEDNYRKKRSRSRTRRDAKRSKKRTRRDSASSESGRDARRIKKRKGSKKNGDLDTRNKRHVKRSKRDVSVSSASSGSRSCSTCRGFSTNSSGEESEHEKRSGRSERKERGKRNVVGKREIKRSRYRSQSRSSYSRSSKGNDYQSEEQLMGENNSSRLRSVITVVKEPEENKDRELDEDWHKEEIIYDHDEYPSCRSNDSNDGGMKRELPHQSQVVTSQKKKDEKLKGEEGIVANVKTTEIVMTGIDQEDRYDGRYLSSDVAEENNQVRENKSGDSAAIGSPDNVDLELILRQRALENLRKFRGGLKIKTAADQKEKNDNDDVKQSSTAKIDLLPYKDGGKVPSATHVVDQINAPTTTKVAARSSLNEKNTQAGGHSKTRSEASKFVQIKSKEDSDRLGTTIKAVDQISVLRVRRNSIPSLEDDGKLQIENYDGTDSRDGRQDVNRPPRLVKTGHSKASEMISVDAISNKSAPSTSALRRDGTCSSLKQGSTSQAPPKDKQMVSKGNVNTSAPENTKTLPTISNNNDEQVINASGSADPDPSSFLIPASGDQSSKELQGEAKEGSQYEQKTMTVMRGGEMVQVNYKVYIPKKTPALARRQLRR